MEMSYKNVILYCMKVTDYFKTAEFKSQPLYKRLWQRFVVAFFETIQML